MLGFSPSRMPPCGVARAAEAFAAAALATAATVFETIEEGIVVNVWGRE